MAGAAVIAKIPIGNNNHFVQVLPGRLNIVQFQSPFELNPDFILNFDYHHIVKLFEMLPEMLDATEKPNETVVEEMTLNDKVVLIYLCTLPDEDTHTFVITRDISLTCTNVTKKNIEEGELILEEKNPVSNFFYIMLKGAILMLKMSPIQQSGIFRMLRNTPFLTNLITPFEQWLEMCVEEKKTILSQIFSKEDDQIALDTCLILNYEFIQKCFETQYLLHLYIINDDDGQ